MVIGEEARDVFSSFTGWEDEGDEAKIKAVLSKFAQYCQPRKNIPDIVSIGECRSLVSLMTNIARHLGS